MSCRKRGYVTGLVILTVIFSLPQIAASFAIGWHAYSTRQSIVPFLPGLRETFYFHVIQELNASGDNLIHLCRIEMNNNGKFEQKIATVDPETADFEFLPTKLTFPGLLKQYRTWACGDRRWFYSASDTTYELVDGQLQQSNLAIHPSMDWGRRGFLIDGQLSLVIPSASGIIVDSYVEGSWKTQGTIVDSDRIWAAFGALNSSNAAGVNFSQVLECDGTYHLFWHLQGRLYHRTGIDVVPSTTPSLPNSDNSFALGNGTTASALNVANFDPSSTGWTQVRDTPAASMVFGFANHPIMIEGKPAAFILDEPRAGVLVGRLYRLIDGSWIEWDSIVLPFGTASSAGTALDDGSVSYVGVCTSQGGTAFYRFDDMGVHETAGDANVKCFGPNRAGIGNPAFGQLWSMLGVWLATMIMGIVAGGGTWLLMWWYTKPDYAFGLSHVRLGSLLWRGIARLIDLFLVLSSSLGVGWILTRDLDWLALCDALNLRLDHPSIPAATLAARVVTIWMVSVILLFLYLQAARGVTPGKWICGLKTVRTSLRPCDLAHVLAREVVFFVDAGNLLCWSPGILFIALTDCRQRMGDIVGDTIVVEVRSLNRCSSDGGNFRQCP